MKSLFNKKIVNFVNDENGFTLLELLVVLVILSLLIGLAGPMVLRQLGKAKTDTAQIETGRLVTNLELFRVDVGRFPTEEEGLNALLVGSGDMSGWQGPYVGNAAQIIDPWQNNYVYTISADGDVATVTSLGADGSEGGTGEDADVSSSAGAS